MSIGQSIAVTPLQLVTAMSAVANDGILLKPHIVKSILNANGSVYMETQVEPVRKTIDSAVDKTLVGLLEQVVATGGGQKAKVRGYRVAGKTGTAQKVNEGGLGYGEGKYIASFLGFGPVEDPQIALLVMIDEPSGIFYGGQIAAPVAGRILTQVFRYLRIEPSETPTDEEEIPADVGEGDSGGSRVPTYAPQTTKTETQEPESEPSEEVQVPNFNHKSIREAARLASNTGLILETSGSGYAVEQSIAAGEMVKRGTKIKINFSPD
jgi:stage V sporulation protein D (sporulation-specific penicillin-binding protein)